MTLYEIIRKAAMNKPSGIAYEYFNYKRTYEETMDDIDKVAAALTDKGIRAGDRVGVCMINSPSLISILYAVNKVGAVAVMLNPKSPAKELKTELVMTECKMLFFTEVAIENIRELVEEDQSIRSLIYVSVPVLDELPTIFKLACLKKMYPFGNKKAVAKMLGVEHYFSYKRFLSEGSLGSGMYNEDPYEKNDEEPAVILFSGGTSGEIKAVVHSSKAINASAVYCLETEKPLPEKIVMMAVLPSFHVFGLTVAVHLPFVAEGTVRLMPFFHADTLCKSFIEEAPVFMAGVPTIFERMLNNKIFLKAAANGSINAANFRHGFVGGDSLDGGVRDRFNSILKENGSSGYISMGYGMTECCPITVNDRTLLNEECIGSPFPGNEVIICKPKTSEELSEGEVGEICVNSPAMMLYGFSEKGRIFKPIQHEDGKEWLHTGDVGFVKDGRVYFECRMRRIIKVSGHTIFSSAIEKTVEKHENVLKAYVVPVPHKTRGHGAFAFIVTRNGISKDEENRFFAELKEICEKELIPYAVPLGYRIIDEKKVPKTPLMKIAWGKLEMAATVMVNE